jgi:glycosyltransferase involved in cell wall biosynthesis/GT2 family glycosyltransferase
VIDPAVPDFTNTPATSTRPRFDYTPDDRDPAPALTIVTPFFNTDPEIFGETVISVQRQSLQQWEWLIVDDGSTRDDSRELLSNLRGSDPRIRVLFQGANRGPASARNAGVSHARSPFVLFLDSDDMLEPTTAEKWLWYLFSHPEHAFVKGFSVGFGVDEYLWRRGVHDGGAILAENVADVTCVIRRSVVQSVGGYDERLRGGLEDWEFWLRCAAAGNWGATIPEYLNWYRRKPNVAERWKNWDDGPLQRELLRAWRRRYPHLWKKGIPRLTPSTQPSSPLEFEMLRCENRIAKQKQRLLLLAPWTALGGADKFNLDLIDQLARRGWETTIVTTLQGDHSWMPEFAKLTPDIFALSHFLKPDEYPRFLRYLIRSRDADAILIAHSVFAYEALPYLRRIASGIPILDYCHAVTEGWLDGGYPRMSADRGELLDLQIVSSAALKDWMVQHGADPQRIEVCYTNVDADHETEGQSRAELIPPDVPLIVYPGRMTDQKQPPVFVKTVLELRRRGHSFLAVAVGDGPYLPWMRKFVRRKRLGKYVRLLGAQSNASARALIAAADCVFIPSTHEGISLAFYEAMGAGVPVVGADVGGQRELVTPDCGVLVQRGEPDVEVQRYADVLGELLDDPERRRAMGTASRERIRLNFTLDQMGDRMDVLLRLACEHAVASPCPFPTGEEARRAALAAVRNVQLSSPAPSPRTRTKSPQAWIQARSPQLRNALFKALSAVGMPVYRVGISFGMHWLEPLKDRVFETLYPRAE